MSAAASSTPDSLILTATQCSSRKWPGGPARTSRTLPEAPTPFRSVPAARQTARATPRPTRARLARRLPATTPAARSNMSDVELQLLAMSVNGHITADGIAVDALGERAGPDRDRWLAESLSEASVHLGARTYR